MASQAQAARLQPPTMAPFAPLPHNACKHDAVRHHLNTMAATWCGSTNNNVTATGAMAAATSGSTSNSNAAPGGGATDMAAYLQQLQDAAAAKSSGGGGATRGEQCPRCASHDTKFCYYNNYNTSQPRHFCRACRRYWTLGGSLRNVPIGGSTRKRPRLAHPHPQQHARRAPAAHVFGLGLGIGGVAPPPPPPMMLPSSSTSSPPSQGQGGGGLLGSLFALGAAGPLLEGRGAGSSFDFDFDLGLGLPTGPLHLGAGEAAAAQMQGLGLRGGGPAAGSSAFLWPAGAGMLVDNDSVDTWKLPGTSAGSMWPDFSSLAAAAPQTGGLMHGGAHAHLM
ncbi:dof zinc finger protein DOF3.4 [Zea mays]|jgi:hypothetical protein|uniref:Dof zinc finger protein n=1 Tax=Zea mays TaxID=4577 RepID=A0A1D6GLQ1_MAIZE|eukprot:XP_008644658.1 dof zinc finger protein DOF3.4 [Zea mays]